MPTHDVELGDRHVEAGQAVYWVRELDGKRADPQHAGIAAERGLLSSNPSKLRVYDVWDMCVSGPRKRQWGARKRFVPQVIGWSQNETLELRYEVASRASELSRRYPALRWGFPPRLPSLLAVRRDGNSMLVDLPSLSCSLFVEACYELAGHDLVSNDQVPLSDGIQRLFPGYQIRAFELDEYPLDLARAVARGEDVSRYASYPW